MKMMFGFSACRETENDWPNAMRSQMVTLVIYFVFKVKEILIQLSWEQVMIYITLLYKRWAHASIT